MKLNELIGSFDIYTTNEEQQELTQLEGMVPFGSFNERQQVIINNLIRKSLVSKIVIGAQTLVVRNDIQSDIS